MPRGVKAEILEPNETTEVLEEIQNWLAELSR